jgi:glycosyltransferase involved in cell wall biosynthesis
MKIRIVLQVVDLTLERKIASVTQTESCNQIAAQINSEKTLLRYLDGMIFCSAGYRQYYAEKTTLPLNAFVRRSIPAVQVEIPRNTHRPVRLLFLGYIRRSRPCEQIAKAVKLVGSGCTLSLVGSSDSDGYREEFQNYVEALGVGEQIKILDAVPPQKMVEMASNFDVGIVALDNIHENYRRAESTRLWTYAAAGLMILGTDLPGIATVVNEFNTGVLIPDTKPESFAKGINSIIDMDDETINRFRWQSLEMAKRYSWNVEKKKFIKVFIHALE